MSEFSPPARSWWSPIRIVLAALIVIVLVLSAALLAVLGSNDDRAVPPPGQTPNAPAAARSAATPTPQALDTTIPTAVPDDLTWTSYRTVALPYSRSAGPFHVDGDVATGYAHTPTGALIASEQIGVRYRISNGWRAVVDTSIAPGPGRDVWIATRSKYGDWPTPAPGSFCQSAGFVFVDYTPERAVLQTVSRCTDGQLQAGTATVSWDGQDWRLILYSDGSVSPTTQQLTSLEGFVPWGGV